MNHYSLKQTVAPAAEPISREEAAEHLRENTTSAATLSYIDRLIVMAREQVEAFIQRQLINATWQLRLDRWPSPNRLLLPMSPVSSVTTFKYYNTSGTLTTLATTEYVLDEDAEPARIMEAFEKTWPVLRNRPGAVEITYVAGYGAAGSSVPASIRQAMFLLIGTMYENRETLVIGAPAHELPLTVERLLNPYCVGDWFTQYGTEEVVAI